MTCLNPQIEEEEDLPKPKEDQKVLIKGRCSVLVVKNGATLQINVGMAKASKRKEVMTKHMLLKRKIQIRILFY